ncbi:MAG: TIGR00341 family protein [Thiovulaceae bacterium]|nr:TIGR00341 family protein [Sulfurimonadaceae bacterium]
MYDRVILLVGISADEELLKPIEEYIATEHQLKMETVLFSKYKGPVEGARYLLYLSDDDIRELFASESSSSIEVGILYNDQCPYAIESFGISKDMHEAIDDALDAEDAIPVDLLKCNGVPVLGSIVIGNVHGMNRDDNSRLSIIKKIADFFSSLFHPAFKGYTITTAKGNITTTAATGIMVFEHNISGVSNNLLREKLSLHGGRLHALILAPSSVVAYLYYLFVSYFFRRLFLEHMPKSIGFVASTTLEITGMRPIDYVIDGAVFKESLLTLKVEEDAVRIHLGRNSTDIPDEDTKEEGTEEKEKEEEKEIVRVQGLPKGEMVSMLVGEAIPFLPRASEEDFKELFVTLRQSASVSSVFIMLMVLSALLATTGLFQNSVPVIIGAMILAPLMSPIVSFAMGVVRGEKEILIESLKTLLIGIVTALLFSCLFTYFVPLDLLTDEMKSRLNPNLLDLMVAIVAGVAGAYAHAKSEIAKSLAGVAIAVALIPPLSVTGIGIGWWNIDIIYGSFLLFMTNLAGMTLAAAMTFLLLGFAPVKRATKGIIWSSLLLVAVTIPLFISFSHVIEQNKIFNQLKSAKNILFDGRTIIIRTISVDLSKDLPVIYIRARSNSVLQDDALQKIKRHINKVVGKPVVVDISSEIELK